MNTHLRRRGDPLSSAGNRRKGGAAAPVRRFLFVVVFVSALSLMALVPGSLGDPPATGFSLRVTGSGTITGCISPGPCDRPDATFSVGAISLPTETGSIGQGGYSFGTAIASASVQCVARNGNLVSVGGTIDSSSGPIVGQHFVVYFLVTSAGGRSGDIAGQVSRPDVNPEATPEEQLPPDFPNTCPTTVGAIAYYPLLSGQVRVVTVVHPLVKKFH